MECLYMAGTTIERPLGEVSANVHQRTGLTAVQFGITTNTNLCCQLYQKHLTIYTMKVDRINIHVVVALSFCHLPLIKSYGDHDKGLN